MGVYNRDGINYSAMLQNAIANRNAAAQRDAEYLINKGKLWGDTAKEVGKTFGRGAMQTYDELSEQDEDDELEELIRRRDAIIMAEQQRRANQEWASSQMEGYTPYSATPEYRAKQQMIGYKEEPNLIQMTTSYDSNYTNPYSYALMQDYYRRSR